jgi:hypothetical protein
MSVVAVLFAGLVAVLFWRQVAAVFLVVRISLVLGGVAFFAQLMNHDGYSNGWALPATGRGLGAERVIHALWTEQAS